MAKVLEIKIKDRILDSYSYRHTGLLSGKLGDLGEAHLWFRNFPEVIRGMTNLGFELEDPCMRRRIGEPKLEVPSRRSI